jgi:hypothetical protein
MHFAALFHRSPFPTSHPRVSLFFLFMHANSTQNDSSGGLERLANMITRNDFTCREFRQQEGMRYDAASPVCLIFSSS